MIFDDTEKLIIDLYNVVLTNGQFAGGGLPIAPQANPSGGLLDVEPAAFQIVPHALDLWLTSDAYENHRHG
jgi:hypothetical protein